MEKSQDKANQLGNSIKQLRLRKDIPQSVLADLAGIQRSAVYRLENGKNTTVNTLISVLSVLDRLDWLDELSPEEPIDGKIRATRRFMQHEDLEYKRKMLLHYYNLSLEDYFDMFNKQHGICGNPGCRIRLDLNSSSGACVDHCHTTGKVRSLLCSGCNTALGMTKEDQERLKGLAEYAKTHNDN